MSAFADCHVVTHFIKTALMNGYRLHITLVRTAVDLWSNFFVLESGKKVKCPITYLLTPSTTTLKPRCPYLSRTIHTMSSTDNIIPLPILAGLTIMTPPPSIDNIPPMPILAGLTIRTSPSESGSLSMYASLYPNALILPYDAPGAIAASAPYTQPMASTASHAEVASFKRTVDRISPVDVATDCGADCFCLAKIEKDERIRRLPCGHVFHQDCIDQWLSPAHNTCPYCRRSVC